MVTVAGPGVAVAEAVKLTETEQVGLQLDPPGKLAVTPVGRVAGSALKATGVVVAPAARVAVMEEAALVIPWTTVRGEGVERVKSNGGAEGVKTITTFVALVEVPGVDVDSVTVRTVL